MGQHWPSEVATVVPISETDPLDTESGSPSMSCCKSPHVRPRIHMSLSYALLEFEPAILGTLFRIVGDHVRARELFHDLHVRLMGQSAASVRDVKAYLQAAARREALRWLIEEREMRHLPLDCALLDTFSENHVPSPEKRTSDQQLLELVLSDIRSHLPSQHARVLLLVRLHGYSSQEVACLLRLPVSTIKSYLRSATQLLAARHGAWWENEVRPGQPETSGKLLYDLANQIEVPAKELIRGVEPQLLVASAAIAERLKNNPDDMYRLESRDFERLILEILHDRGHEAHLTPATRDGGKDILAYFDSDICGKLLCLVETKRYARHRKVGFDVVQRLYGAFASQGANCAMLVTTSSFTEPARILQSQHRYQLVLREYADIVKWIRDYGTRTSPPFPVTPLRR